jgi:hypothetical protein
MHQKLNKLVKITKNNVTLCYFTLWVGGCFKLHICDTLENAPLDTDIAFTS